MTAERREVPEAWRWHMIAAGAVDPRTENKPRDEQRPSMSRLAEMSGTKTTTISHMMYGTRDTDPAIIAKVAKALGIGLNEMHALMRIVGTDEKDPFRWPPEVDMLNARERQALTELILAMAERAKERTPGKPAEPKLPETGDRPHFDLAAHKDRQQGRRGRGAAPER
jgi:transcriptional regulator with XRE-family HTH domain